MVPTWETDKMTHQVEHRSTENRTLYYFNHKKHRANGPASIWHTSGNCFWYLNGELHRYYGPVSEMNNDWRIKGNLVKWRN